ncbi:MAG: fluoride efflux transporter CrcB [Gemmataceae bacterium]
MRVLLHIGLVGLGSGLGGLTRWVVHLGLSRWLGKSWPIGTLLINVTGCLFLGWFATVLTRRMMASEDHAGLEELRLLLAVGFAGGYTTFSTFGVETDSLLREGNSLGATLYVVLSVVLGLLAVRFGAWLAGGV